MRCLLGRLILLTGTAGLAIGLAARVTGESLPGIVYPRHHESPSGRYVYRAPGRQGDPEQGTLYRRLLNGTEKPVWTRRLVCTPIRIVVADEWPIIVTTGVYGNPLERQHDLVAYNTSGKAVADYSWEELFTAEERAAHRSAGRWTSRQHRHSFRRLGDGRPAFVIEMDWGKVITVDLETGKLLGREGEEKAPPPTQGRG